MDRSVYTSALPEEARDVSSAGDTYHQASRTLRNCTAVAYWGEKVYKGFMVRVLFRVCSHRNLLLRSARGACVSNVHHSLSSSTEVEQKTTRWGTTLLNQPTSVSYSLHMSNPEQEGIPRWREMGQHGDTKQQAWDSSEGRWGHKPQHLPW